jgi:hypothetical protein
VYIIKDLVPAPSNYAFTDDGGELVVAFGWVNDPLEQVDWVWGGITTTGTVVLAEDIDDRPLAVGTFEDSHGRAVVVWADGDVSVVRPDPPRLRDVL